MPVAQHKVDIKRVSDKEYADLMAQAKEYAKELERFFCTDFGAKDCLHRHNLTDCHRALLAKTTAKVKEVIAYIWNNEAARQEFADLHQDLYKTLETLDHDLNLNMYLNFNYLGVILGLERAKEKINRYGANDYGKGLERFISQIQELKKYARYAKEYAQHDYFVAYPASIHSPTEAQKVKEITEKVMAELAEKYTLIPKT